MFGPDMAALSLKHCVGTFEPIFQTVSGYAFELYPTTRHITRLVTPAIASSLKRAASISDIFLCIFFGAGKYWVFLLFGLVLVNV